MWLSVAKQTVIYLRMVTSAIARKVIQIISTEDRIEITSPKEITLTAGSSQLLLVGEKTKPHFLVSDSLCE